MKNYGLVGHSLSHSFSKKYFSDKFEKMGIVDCRYDLFDIMNIGEIERLKSNPNIQGLNVTIPYKEEVISHLDRLDESAEFVGAVNVVKRTIDNQWIGYNSDYYGFKESLINWLPTNDLKALVLGTGGASKAVVAVLNKMGVEYSLVSRSSRKVNLTYDDINEDDSILSECQLIINTTPLGMHPNIELSPNIRYELLTGQHYLYDLVYNPPVTEFLEKGKLKGCEIKNGLEMLELQAEKSWQIWNMVE